MSSFFYFIKESLKGFTRNLSTALGSIVTIFLSLLIIGVFLVGGFVVEKLVSSVESEVSITAYVSDDASDADIQSVENFIEGLDGDRGHEWTTNEVTSALKREEGENVVITWRRASSLDDEGGEEFTTTLVCSNYAVKNVETELSDTVGYIKLKQITQNAADLVKNAVADLESQGATSFVLDIRDNPGGFLTQSVDIASLFVKSGTIVKIQTKAEETSKTTSRPYVTEKPLVLLVNGKTSASAEVLAASLKDNQRATLVGSTTLGKGSVQVTRDLSFGGALRYTAAFYKSPLGHDIEGVGVTPDVMVGLAEGEDNQKALALETAQSLVKG